MFLQNGFVDVKHIQMVSTFICLTYTDVKHMDMPHIYTVLSFFRRDPISAEFGS